MTPELKHFYIARVTLQTATPLSIAAGGADGVFDVRLVRDANGLPVLPGSSVAGVLRHRFRDLYGDEETDRLFGYQDGDDGEPSRLHVSWGAIQDSEGCTVEGLLLGDAGRVRLATDPVLQSVADHAARETRDRVRIGHWGAAADTGKFDRAVLPAGHRFSVELSLWSAAAEDPRWQQVLALLWHPLFRLGGGTRAGLGGLRVVRVHRGHFDLGDVAGREAFQALRRGLGDLAGLASWQGDGPTRAGLVTATLTLKPRAFWRIGEGEGGPEHLSEDGKPADLLPKLEARWDFDAKAPKAVDLLIPASSLKGLLAHRVAFHANRRAARWADDLLPAAGGYDKSLHCVEVRELFGYARDARADESTDADAETKAPRGQAGRVFIDDAYLELNRDQLKIMMHNAIDRFTGGVREHMLFSEELVWKGEIAVHMAIDTRCIGDAARAALRDALDDLCQGRTAIGGGAAKGHGFCDGRLDCDDQGRWINGTEQDQGKREAA